MTRWRERLATVSLLVFLAAFTHVAQAQTPQRTELVHGHEAVANEVLVKFRPTAPQRLREIEADEDVDDAEEVGGAGLRRMRSRSKDVATLVGNLSARPDVEYAEPNYILRAALLPNDTRFGELWGLQNTGETIGGVPGTPGADIEAALAWDLSTGSRANVVGVVDTGVDYNHPDLAANIWTAPSAFTVTVGGLTITCVAGTHGFNAITNTCDPLDDHDHGTHVAGTIGAVGNNGTGVVGVNWTASIMGLKFLNAAGSGTTADAIKALAFARQVKAAGIANVRVTNNSWGGGGFSLALLDEINLANAGDILFVAAAGNSALNNDIFPHFPSSYDAANVVAVAATTNTDALASFSNFGASSVDLGAPGSGILSTVRFGAYASFSGTSMATPHVAGAAALVLASCALTTASLRAQLLNNVDPVGSLDGRTVTGGRLNVNRAIRACGLPDFALSISPVSQSVTAGGSASYTVTITPSGGFSGSVNLSASGLPAGAAAPFSPNPATAASTMTLTTGAATPTGAFTLTVTGTSGTLTHTATATLVVTVPDFAISLSPASRTVVQGASTTYTVTVSPSGGFSGSVNLSAIGLPADAAASFIPNPATATSTMTLTTGAASPTGAFTLTVTGTNVPLTHTATATLVVNAAPNFSLTASPATLTTTPAGRPTSTITITRSGCTASVGLSASGAPAGTEVRFNPASTTGTSSTVEFRTSGTTPGGTFPVTITGTGCSLTRTTIITLVVSGGATPSFTLSASPASLSLAPGGSGTSTITVTPSGGFTGAVSLSASGMPAGTTVSFSVNPTTSTWTATIATSATTPPGTSTLTITGTSGALTRTTSVTLIVSVPDFTLSATPVSQTVAPGASSTFTTNVNRLGGFAEAVSLSVSGLPAGASGSFSPNPVTGSSATLTVSTLTSTPTGTFPLTITGTSVALTRTTSVTLVVASAPGSGFTLSVTPASQTVRQDDTATYTVTITRTGGFTGAVSFSLSGAPAGSALEFRPVSTTGNSSELRVRPTSAGTFTLTVTGVSGSLTRTANATLIVNSR